jgi:hypothetical protein
VAKTPATTTGSKSSSRATARKERTASSGGRQGKSATAGAQKSREKRKASSGKKGVGSSRLASFLNSPTLRKVAAAGLASAAAALLYRKSEGQASGPADPANGLRLDTLDEASDLQARSPSAKSRRAREAPNRVSASAPAAGASPEEPASKRKKRRDAGVKKAQRKAAVDAPEVSAAPTAGTEDQGERAVRSADTFLTGPPTDALAEAEVEAHPS